MVGILLFPFGMAYIQVRTVSFRECNDPGRSRHFQPPKQKPPVIDIPSTAPPPVASLGAKLILPQLGWNQTRSEFFGPRGKRSTTSWAPELVKSGVPTSKYKLP